MNIRKPCGLRLFARADSMSFTTPRRHIFLDLSGLRTCMRISCEYLLSPLSQSASLLMRFLALLRIVACCSRCPRQHQSSGVSYSNTLLQRPLSSQHCANPLRPASKPSLPTACVNPSRKARHWHSHGTLGGRYGVCYRARVTGRSRNWLLAESLS
jgi:hypothetical protein